MRTSNHQHNGKLLLFFIAMVLTTGNSAKPRKGPLQPITLTSTEGADVPIYFYEFTATNNAVKLFKVTGETYGKFSISDGWLTCNKSLDREEQANYKLQIEGLNENDETIEGPEFVTVKVLDINDNQPSFTENQYEGVVRQNSRPGRPFMYVNAIDLDDPETPNAKIEYSISQQVPISHGAVYFQIDNETGAISTTEDGYNSLDPTVEGAYQLIVNAKDSAALPLTTSSVVKITVKENLWKSPGKIEITENSTDPHPKIITQVEWNEPGAIFELKPKNKMAYPKFPFVIDATGNISVTEPLDREEISEYVLLAYALDKNREPLETPLEIVIIVEDINDNHPICNDAVTMIEVQENEDIGSFIGAVLATDEDEGGTSHSSLSYAIVDQDPKIPDDNMFTIDQYNGKIQRFKGHLQKQNAPEYILKVRVTDQLGQKGGLTTECMVNISVIDINDMIPIFEKSEYGPITLAENTSLDTVLIEIQATDNDEPLTGSSEILYTVVEGDEEGTFKIITEESTNKGKVQLAKPLNFEDYSAYKLKISATNPEPLVKGVEYNSSSFTYLFVNVTNNDEPPQFLESSYQKWIFENASKGAIVLKVEAKDPEGAGVSYKLYDPDKRFKIDSETGEISIEGELDAEKKNRYEINAIAMEKDNPNKRSTVKISIYLQDINDNPPKLAAASTSFSICLPVKEEERIIIQAEDYDVQFGAPFKFSISKNPGKKFNIEHINGTHASVTLAFGSHTEEIEYKIPLTITDSGSPPLEGSSFLEVNICKCAKGNKCFIPLEEQSGPSRIGLAVGLLLGTFAVIGLILAVVLLRTRHRKSDKIDPKATRNENETIPLANA
ncbi:cadherin-17 [Cetorhinus maximus]